MDGINVTPACLAGRDGGVVLPQRVDLRHRVVASPVVETQAVETQGEATPALPTPAPGASVSSYNGGLLPEGSQ